MGTRSAGSSFPIRALLILGFIGCAGDEPAVTTAEREQLLAGSLEVGSLIIPMDTLSQDHGMLRAYGLVYRLLASGVPVRWSVAPGKAQNGVDFSASTRDLETGHNLGTLSYRGGPFIIAAADRAAALPIINAWLASDCVTVVHEAVESFTAEPTRLLSSAPRLAVALDRYQTIAFANFNAAGIPDSTGARWSAASPDLLDQDELAGASAEDDHDGALWNPDGGPAYCHLTFTYYWTDKFKTAGVVRELRSWLGAGNLTHLFAQAESLRTIESSPHGQFLTTGGVVDDGSTPWTTGTWTPGEPLAQFHGSFRGSPDVMDSIGLAPGSQFYPATSRMMGAASAPAAASRLLLLSGPRDGVAGNGRATYLAGFDYGISLPISTHPWTNGVRILLNSVLSSECNLAENQPRPRLLPAATAQATGNQLTFTIAYQNEGAGFASDATLEATVPAGTTLVAASGAGAAVGGVVRWQLGTLTPGETGTATLTVAASAAGTYTTALTLRHRAGVTPRSVSGSQTGSVGASSEPPDTLFLGAPPSPTDATEAGFALGSDESPVTFECSLDGAAFAPCEATFTLTDLAPGAHTLAARATDGDGNVDPSPAVHSWQINRTPTARPDSAVVAEDGGELLIDVLANDTRGDAPTTIIAFTSPSQGTVQQHGEKLGYTPLANVHGPDSFSYTIRDADGQTSSATVEIEVLSVDDVPVAQDDSAEVSEDGEVLISVLGNDSGLGDAPVAVTAVSAPFHGSAAVIGNRVQYAPAPDYHGPELVTYTLTDADGDTASATVVITVTPVNDVPVAQDDTAAVAEDGAVELAVLANDTIGDAPASVSALGPPAHGSAAVGADGTVLYTPAANYHGADSFTYTVTDADGETARATALVLVTSVDDVPVAVDDTATTAEDVAVAIAALGNDLGLGDAPVSISGVTAPARGVVTVMGDLLLYTPAPDANGLDSFTYSITDGDGQSATATVSVAVQPADDVPEAVADAFTVAEDAAATLLSVLDNDVSGDAPTTLTFASDLPHGSAVLLGNQVVYTPDADYAGADAFSYQLTDGNGQVASATVTITVTEVDDLPVAVDDAAATLGTQSVLVPVLANDTGLGDAPVAITAVSAPSVGAAAIEGLAVRYTPVRTVGGEASFTYTVSDADGDTATATVRVAVTAVNSVPVAIDDAAEVFEDSSALIAVRANDTGGDAPVTLTAVSAPAHGSAAIEGDEVLYTPAANYTGADAFTYTVRDEDGETATATVSVAVLAVDDVPEAVDDAFTVAEDSGGTLLPVLDNDVSGDAPTTLTFASDPPHGSAVLLGDQVVYTPDADYAGLDLFSYQLTDGNGQVASATVAITVTQVDDLPVAVDDAVATLGNQSVLVPVLANDAGLGDAPVTLLAVSTPTVGAAVIEGAAVRYTPVRTVGGEVTFTYTLRDADGDTATATVRVAVTAVNSVPVAVNDVATVLEDGTVLIAVRANDTGGDAPVVISAVSDPPRGTATIEAGAVRYTPDANLSGADSFTYTVRDEDGETATATVSVTVTAVNDTPSAQVDTFTVVEDSSNNTLNVLANDLGIGDAPLTVTLVSAPVNGSATVVGNQLVYTPNANYTGTDSFTYRVRDADGQQSSTSVFVTVTNVNDPPTANPDTFNVTGGVATTLNVLSNDRDVDGNPLTLVSVATPSAGTATVSGNQVVYTGPAGFTGTIVFTYVVRDSVGATATGTVTVNVTASAGLTAQAARSTVMSISGSPRVRQRLQ